MSDTFYREQAARRSRLVLISAVVILVIACLAFGAYSAFNDTCTGSFDRSPQSVVESYISAIASGDQATAAACWHHLSYLDLESGCSEVCLSRLWGTPFQLAGVQLNEVEASEEGRARLQAQVSISCPDGEQHSGEVLLDSVASNVPWRHWKIIRSNVGGPLSAPWCQ
jgi:hypothetical protein